MIIPLAVVGTQWGDEGKGKAIDRLAEKADAAIRYNGGANAGHTVHVGEDKFVYHILPSAMHHPKVLCIVGNGVLVDVPIMHQEREDLKKSNMYKRGEFSLDNLILSSRANMALLTHRVLDALYNPGKNASTLRGIPFGYGDKSRRIGPQLGDIKHKDFLERRLKNCLKINLAEIRSLASKKDIERILAEDLVDELTGKNMSEFFSPKTGIDIDRYSEYLTSLLEKDEDKIQNTSYLIKDLLDQDKKIIFEGAQGTRLDIDVGDYHNVTSSNATAAGVFTGAGIAPCSIDVLGVTKAYTTKVGEGTLPTKIDDEELEEELREKGEEYGASTGRKRMVGWFDAPEVKNAIMLNGVNWLFLTKLDILGGLKKIKICTHYEIDGERTDQYPDHIEKLRRAKPIYEEVDGWETNIEGITEYGKLPDEAKYYLERIRSLTDRDIAFIGTGKKRNQVIEMNNILKPETLLE